MDRGPLAATLERIENAFMRIDAAIGRPRAPTSSASGPAALVEENMRLRETIGESLTEIDALIARLDR